MSFLLLTIPKGHGTLHEISLALLVSLVCSPTNQSKLDEKIGAKNYNQMSLFKKFDQLEQFNMSSQRDNNDHNLRRTYLLTHDPSTQNACWSLCCISVVGVTLRSSDFLF
jgi:hypothetical protein